MGAERSNKKNDGEKSISSNESGVDAFSVMNLLKLITPDYISQLSTFIGGGEKKLLTKTLMEEISTNFNGQANIIKYMETLQEKENLLKKKKLTSNNLKDIKNENKEMKKEEVKEEIIEKQIDEKIDEKIVEKNENETADNNVDSNVDNNKVVDMPDIFGNSIMNLLKVLNPTEISRLSQRVGGKKKVSITEMLTDQTQTKDFQASKTKKNKDKNKDKDKEGVKENKKSKQSNENIEELKNNPSKVSSQKQLKLKNDNLDDDGYYDGDDEEEVLASTVFLLQEKEKIKKSQDKLKSMKIFDSYNGLKNIIKKKKNINDESLDKLDEDILDLEEKEKKKKKKKQDSNQGILFDKNQR
ncbi:MAG: hypothetical protein HQK49_08620 [Oligoflexia bacterium]|nr:hypothetical protein [Oligoflexia bacterium]